MSGYGLLDGTINGISSDIFMKNMDTFDFPMESLEGDDLNRGYWDAKLKSLVPVLSGVLTGSPLTSGGNIGNDASVMMPGFSDPSAVPNSVEEAFRASMPPHHNNYSDDPVSVHGCKSSCSSATIYRNRSAASEGLSLSGGFSESNLSESTKKLVRRRKKKKKLAQLSDVTQIMQRYTECKKCSHCERSQIPEWRDGPMGRTTLCNACEEVGYRSGRLFAEYWPEASPTFVSHKKAVEMRDKVQDFVPIISEAYTSSPSFVSAESFEVKPNPNVVKDASRSSIFVHNNYPNVLDSGALQTPSPVSAHQNSSSSSCSNEMCMSVSSGIVTRSMRSRFSTINPPRFSATKKLFGSKGFSEPGLMITKENLFKRKPHLKLPKLWDTTSSKKCLHCGSKKTPQWRQGPMGKKTLCNACGVRYRSGHLFPEYRPVASPAFVPSAHSNFHKVVVQMRKKALQEG